MSKKKFSEGLDDLFKESPGTVEALETLSTTEGAPRPERRPSVKNFMTDLDALLQEALDESLEKYDAAQPNAAPSGSKSKSQPATPFRSGLGGLDALIRQTIDVQELSTDEASGKRRLTVAVDLPKLEKLKAIARMENAYMKDLLVNLIDEFIEEYTRDKGLDL